MSNRAACSSAHRGRFTRETHGAILARLAELADSGAITPLLDEQRFELAQVGDAYARLTSGQAVGKLVVDITD